MYSDISIRISAFSSPNIASASALLSSVLPTPVRAEEQERTDRALRVTQADTAAADGLGNRGDGFALADDALVQRILEVQQALTLVLGQLSDRNAGPAGDNGCNVVLGDSTVGLGLLVSPLLLASLQSLALGFLFVAQLGSILVVLTLDSLLLLRSNGCDLVLKLLEVQGERSAWTGGRGSRPRR